MGEAGAGEHIAASEAINRELEIRFTIAPNAVERLVAQPLFAEAQSDRQITYLITTYFDTPDMALAAQRASLRVRRSSNGTVQTLKTSSGSRVARGEWECAADGGAPDPSWLATTPMASFFSDNIVGALEPQFVVEVSRTIYPLQVSGSAIEVALDSGTIKGRGLSLPISEVEFELKSGEPQALIACARRLIADVPLTVGLTSKSERGYGLLDGSWGHPNPDLALDFAGSTTLAAGWEAAIQACLASVCANAALVEGREQVDAVHKTRTALRRLRTVMQTFKPATDLGRVTEIRCDLKWIWQILGAARDADVLQAAIGDRSDDTGSNQHEVIRQRVTVARHEAHESLLKALQSRRWRRLLLDLLELSLDGIDARRQRHDLASFLASRLDRKRRKLGKTATGLTKLDQDALHDVRKRAKTLRYDIEIFGSVPDLSGDEKDLGKLRNHCRDLQDALGVLQDAEAIERQLHALMKDGDGEASDSQTSAKRFAAAMLSDGPDEDELRKRAKKAAKKIRKADVF